MRKIKFRVWDSDKKVMDNHPTIMEMDDNGLIISKIFVWLQYTGLKDKDNNEIYEGDVIRDSSLRLMIVEWDNKSGASRFIFRAINTIGYIKAGRLIDSHDWIVTDDNDIEVIGNIYENPELLEGA